MTINGMIKIETLVVLVIVQEMETMQDDQIYTDKLMQL